MLGLVSFEFGVFGVGYMFVWFMLLLASLVFVVVVLFCLIVLIWVLNGVD